MCSTWLKSRIPRYLRRYEGTKVRRYLLFCEGTFVTFMLLISLMRGWDFDWILAPTKQKEQYKWTQTVWIISHNLILPSYIYCTMIRRYYIIRRYHSLYMIFGIADLTRPQLPKCNNHLVSFIKVDGLSVSYIVDIFDTIKSRTMV